MAGQGDGRWGVGVTPPPQIQFPVTCQPGKGTGFPVSPVLLPFWGRGRAVALLCLLPDARCCRRFPARHQHPWVLPPAPCRAPATQHPMRVKLAEEEGGGHSIPLPSPATTAVPARSGPTNLAGAIIFPISGFSVPSVKSQLNYFPPSPPLPPPPPQLSPGRY